MQTAGLLGLIRRAPDPDTYRQIRRLWLHHSTAVRRQDIPALLETLTEDCVYELNGDISSTWRGHAGATEFYTSLLNAFPGFYPELCSLVIGPQGVFEEARVNAIHRYNWLNYLATGERVSFNLLIFFPWDPDRSRFAGERIYFFHQGHPKMSPEPGR